MAYEIELNPVDHLTVGYVGAAGDRTFYIQAFKGAQVVTLLCEKQQVQSLAINAERFIKSIQRRFPQLPAANDLYHESDMALREPLEPLFRAGEIGLGYDEDADLLVLLIQELQADEETGEVQPGSIVRFWLTRSQLLAVSRYGSIIVKQGRPAFQERRNGHHK